MVQKCRRVFDGVFALPAMEHRDIDPKALFGLGRVMSVFRDQSDGFPFKLCCVLPPFSIIAEHLPDEICILIEVSISI